MAEIRKFLDPSGLSLLWDKVKDELDKKADETSLPTKVSELQNDAGYLTQETDPTVPSWAKAQVKPSYTAQEVGALPDNTFIPSNVSDLTNDTGFITSAALPTNVSDLTNDAGYLTQETDPTVPAWAKAVNKPSYTAQEVGALPSNTFIPSKVSDLVDDSGHYTKPVTGIPATDLEETYLTQHQDISMKANSADLATVATSGEYNDLLHTPTNVSAFTNDAGYLIQHQDISGKADKTLFANEYEDLTYPVQRFTLCFHNGELYYAKNIIEQQEAWDSTHWIKLDGINGLYVNEQLNFEQMNQKLRKKYEKPVTGIPASDLEETYLTSFTETDPTVPNWAKAAQKPTYTAQEVGALPDNTYIPTKVSDLDNDSGYLTQHQDISGKANSADLAAVATSGAYSDLNGTPTNVSSFTNDAGYLTSESDPTVPSWAKAVNKPTYTASEVGAPTVSEMNTAISNAIGNVHQFGIEVVQELPTTGIKEHTVYFVPKTGETNDVYDEYIRVNNAWEMIGNTQIDLSNYATKSEIPNVPVQDVQVNGTSILVSGVANVPLASRDNFGVVKLLSDYGVDITTIGQFAGVPYIAKAPSASIKAGANQYRPIVPYNQHESIFYALAKLAGADMAQSSNAVGTYTDEAKQGIQKLFGFEDILGTYESSTTASKAYIVGETFIFNGKRYRVTADIAQNYVIIPGTNCELDPIDGRYVKDTDKATTQKRGLVKIDPNFGVALRDSPYEDVLMINRASDEEIKLGNHYRKPIVSVNQHKAVFYGLAKAAGDTTQSQSDNAIGTYTTEAKTAIRTMIDAVGKTDYATANIPGLVKPGSGIALEASTGKIYMDNASDTQIKGGTATNIAIPPFRQHSAVFYGLTKAAGVDMASSSNAVGTYTEAAKTAIRGMLGIDGSAAIVEQVTGTAPTIIGMPNVRYVCGEVSLLTITPPACGSIEVIFTSGSTASTLTVPNSVKWPAWFEAEELDSNMIYDIIITDAAYGAVMAWAN